MLIVNQDHDRIYFAKRADLSDSLYTLPKFYEGVLMGINLYFKTRFLGTFDSTGKAMGEMNRILLCKGPICCVKGKADWEQWEMIKTTKGDDGDEMA